MQPAMNATVTPINAPTQPAQSGLVGRTLKYRPCVRDGLIAGAIYGAYRLSKWGFNKYRTRTK